MYADKSLTQPTNIQLRILANFACQRFTPLYIGNHPPVQSRQGRPVSDLPPQCQEALKRCSCSLCPATEPGSAGLPVSLSGAGGWLEVLHFWVSQQPARSTTRSGGDLLLAGVSGSKSLSLALAASWSMADGAGGEAPQIPCPLRPLSVCCCYHLLQGSAGMSQTETRLQEWPGVGTVEVLLLLLGTATKGASVVLFPPQRLTSNGGSEAWNPLLSSEMGAPPSSPLQGSLCPSFPTSDGSAELCSSLDGLRSAGHGSQLWGRGLLPDWPTPPMGALPVLLCPLGLCRGLWGHLCRCCTGTTKKKPHPTPKWLAALFSP